MYNILPVYSNSETIQPLLNMNQDIWLNTLDYNLGNNIPAFISDKIAYTSLPSVSSWELKKVNKTDLKNQTLSYDNTDVLDETYIQLISDGTHYQLTLMSDYYATELTQSGGLFQWIITMSDSDTIYSDVFCLDGVPLQTYSCSNISFDSDTFDFDIRVTRTDVYTTSDSAVFVIYSQPLSGIPTILYNTPLTLLSGEFLDITVNVEAVADDIDYIGWYGACESSYDIETQIAEDSSFEIAEDDSYVLTENN